MDNSIKISKFECSMFDKNNALCNDINGFCYSCKNNNCLNCKNKNRKCIKCSRYN